ncbi:superoxide dismutase [Clostridium sp. 'White wine YQ']|uniref:superoxide dismutase n=1 Tax=Clostridium sp. 'White wine YQ' TaxID=3027474 RepID=UPI003FCDEC63
MKKLVLIFLGFILIMSSTINVRATEAFKEDMSYELLSELYNLKYPYEVPALKYKYNALEPYIDEATMMLHHDKHHKAYVDNLNKALEKYPELQAKTLKEILSNIEKIPQEVREAIRNNGGGHFNHSFFWQVMAPNKGGEAKGELKNKIDKTYGSFDKFKEQFKKAALERFGSGWAWLVKDQQGNLKIISTANQDTPLALGVKPIIAIDVWEHAYYLKYQNKRAEYIDNWWNVVDWDRAEVLANS